MNYYSIVLSAGKGSRMKSEKPKVLQDILGTPMISLVLDELISFNIKQNYLVLGYKKEEVLDYLKTKYDNLKYAEQNEQLGTAHAILQLKDEMKDLEGITIITCGDTPLLTKELFKELVKHHEEYNNDLTILSTTMDDPFGYGRIIRSSSEEVLKIVEQKDASPKEEAISEINGGIYCVNNKLLFDHIEEIENNNSQEEYYLTDIIKIFINNNYKVDAFKIDDSQSIMGVNDYIQLAQATKALQLRINEKHLSQGVKIIDPTNTYISKDVVIGRGTIIYPNNYLINGTTIGENNILKPGNYIDSCIIGNNNEIGPMAHLRMETELKDHIRIGNFVEVKKSTLENGVKSAHLTYLGDSFIGENTNIGCGVITANYDGKNKFNTNIGSNNFIGSNVNLIAPVTLKDNVFVAAGTTVTQDIEQDKFVIGREKEKIKERR